MFSDSAMQQHLSQDDYTALKKVIEEEGVLETDLADKVADAMKEWAMGKGATHYTHWFQPLTGYTAEKHDSFISIDKDGNTILEFSGKNLTKGEADASSFPSGGIRATFEARGYTVWDTSSPAFIKRSLGGAGVLCIPTAFCAYTGEILDNKTPLLRSMEFINRESVRLLKLIGVDANKVSVDVGAEQEYFLVDKELFKKRLDLKFTGRTLFGAVPPKGQEKSDQYYANIKERVLKYMADLNEELWKLGITAKTQHNEAAPAQHELAPIYTSVNIATDQNQLIMEMMKKVADRNGLACLLHEKPFKGLNGSGKHNNWSLSTDKGLNLLRPRTKMKDNLVFLVFCVAVLAGVNEYADLLRMSTSVPGNDLRLGGHEAPPAIISAYVGDDILKMFESIENGQEGTRTLRSFLRMGAHTLPEFKQDLADRNRTSPFAFTGNKFEFRMVGASDSIANPNIVLNTITGEILKRISNEIEDTKKTNPEKDIDEILSVLIVKYIKNNRQIIFNGNNYSDSWKEEAAKRGLPNIDNCVDSFEALMRPGVVKVFEENCILNKKELFSRYEIYLENYSKTMNIEAMTMLLMAKTQIMPAVMNYQGRLGQDFMNLSRSGSLGSVQLEQITEIEKLLVKLNAGIKALERALRKALQIETAREQAVSYRDGVVPAMQRLRETTDKLQGMVTRAEWPYPDYADLLFYD